MTSPILDADELAIVQSGGYEGSAYLILGPQEPLFAARVNGAVTGVISFAQIAYDTVTVGAYTDVLDGMDIRISRTNDIRKAYFLGRVRKAPTSGLLYINETSKAVADNDFVFVLNNYPVVVKKRYKTFLDWDVTFKKPQPVIKGVDSAYAALTTAATASFSFPNAVGQALAKGATITTYAWSIPGATYTTGSAASQNPAIEVETPYNDWGRVTITDSNGTPNTLAFTVSAGDPNNPAHTFFRLCHEPIPLTADWANGYSTSVLFWKGFEDVLDRSRVTVVADERFNGGTLDAISPVRFVGYLKTNNRTVRGDETHGQIKEISVEIASFLQLAGELRFDPIAIRHTTTPMAWDQINTPTPARSISHLLRHSTLLNVCAMDFGTIDDTYFSGNMNVSDTSLMDAEKRVASEINVYVTQGGAGSLSFERDPRVMTTADRDDVPVATPTPINLGDVLSYKLVDVGEDKIGAIEVGFAVFLTSTNSRYYLTANAPAAGFDDAQGQAQVPNQLLAANSSLADAKSEGGQRTGHLLAIENTRRTLEIVFGSGWGFINPCPGLWYCFEIDAEDDPGGVGIAATERWLCVSKSMTINSNGTQDCTARFTEETAGGTALTLVSYNPSVIDSEQVVMPIRDVIGAFPSSASINYDTVDPENPLHRDPFDDWSTAPLTPQEAADAAAAQPGPGCAAAYTNFRYDGQITMGFLTKLDADYTVKVSGSAVIEGGSDTSDYNFRPSDQGWVPGGGSGDQYAHHYVTEGWGRGSFTGRVAIFKVFTGTIIEVKLWYNEPIDRVGLYNTTGTFNTYNVTGTNPTITGISIVDGLFIDLYDSASNTVSPTFRLTRALIITQPTGDTTKADSFYQWELDADGNVINVNLLSGAGLRVDATGVPVSDSAVVPNVPPFSENHEYEFPFIGTGYAVAFKFLDTDYSDNQSAPLNFKICGPRAGS